MRAANAWLAVVDEEGSSFHTLEHALGLDARPSRVILRIMAEMITPGDQAHSVVLRSPIKRTGDDVDFTIWTWTRLQQVHVSVAKFESTYLGATIAYGP